MAMQVWTERRLGGLAVTVQGGVRDPIALLRLARTLKVIHGQMQGELRDRIRTEGNSYTFMQANSALDAVEVDLRRILLEYTSMRPHEILELLRHAVNQTLDVYDVLTARPAAVAYAG